MPKRPYGTSPPSVCLGVHSPSFTYAELGDLQTTIQEGLVDGIFKVSSKDLTATTFIYCLDNLLVAVYESDRFQSILQLLHAINGNSLVDLSNWDLPEDLRLYFRVTEPLGFYSCKDIDANIYVHSHGQAV